MKLTLAVYDENTSYVERLIRFAEKELSAEFTVIPGREGSAEGAEVILASENRFASGEVPGDRFTVLFSENRDVKRKDGLPVVFRYQPADALLRLVRRLYVEKNKYELTGRPAGRRAEVYVFLSPAGGTGTSTIALAHSLRAAREGMGVVLLDLQLFSGQQALGLDQGMDFSEVSYAVKMKTNLPLRLEDALGMDISGVKYFGAAADPEDLLDFTGSDTRLLVGTLRDEGFGDIIVVDADCDTGERCSVLLSEADRIFLVTDGTDAAAAKSRLWLESLRRDQPEILRKISLVINRMENNGEEPVIPAGVPVHSEEPFVRGRSAREVVEILSRRKGSR